MKAIVPRAFDRPIRVVLWSCVIGVAVFGMAPFAADAFANGILFVFMIEAYLVLADLAIRLTSDALNRRSVMAPTDNVDTPLRAARRGARNVSFHLFAWSVALCLCHINEDMYDPGAALEFISVRIGMLLLGLGAFVLYVSWRRLQRAH